MPSRAEVPNTAPAFRGARLALHADASAESVAMLRVGVFLLCAAESWVLFRQAAPIPSDGWVPFGLLTWLPAAVLEWLRTVAGQEMLFASSMGLCVAAALGLVPRLSLPLAAVVFIVAQAVPRALQGLVNHAQVPLMLAAVILSLGAAADALVAWPRRRVSHDDGRYQATLVYILAGICIGYSLIAAHRVAYGGMELFGDESLLQWFMQRSVSEADPEQGLGTRLVRTPWLATAARLAFPLITLLELLAPLCLLYRRFRLLFIPAMLTVHLAIYLLMHISFSHLAALFVVFIDASAWSPRRTRRDAHGAPQPLTVFFDGVCGLCNRFVDYLLPRDTDGALRFAPLQGSTAAGLGTLPRDVDSVITFDGERIATRSDAALAAISRLGGLWAFASVFGLVPRPVRDAVYAFIARNRYAWFGKAESCRLPTPAEAPRFLP